MATKQELPQERKQLRYQLLRPWLGREDSNLRMAESKSAALPLGYAPSGDLLAPPRRADHSRRNVVDQRRSIVRAIDPSVAKTRLARRSTSLRRVSERGS